MMLDPFVNPAFSATSLTAAINLLPPASTLIESMGLMPERGVNTRTIIVEERDGKLALLPTRPLGTPGSVGSANKRRVRSFVIPHIPHDDAIFPADVAGLRSFGQESGLEALSTLVNDRQAQMRLNHDITLEHLRFGALNGVILDADGSTLYDLVSEFGLSAATGFTTPAAAWKKRLTLDFELDAGGTDVLKKTIDLARHIEANLNGEMYSDITCLVRSSFFDALTSHAAVKAAYALWQDGAQARNDMRKGFRFGSVNFIEHEVSVGGQPMIPDGEGVAFPSGPGTANMFATYFAPADFNEAVNTLGKRLYSKIEARQFGRGWDLHTQSNPLPVCLRPAAVVNVVAS